MFTYDVVIQDSVGMSYSGNTTSGIGGSEHHVIKLARALAKAGLKVLVRNNLAGPPEISADGVLYESRITPREVECKALILQRMTPLPFNVEFDKLLVQVHDMPGAEHEILLPIYRRLKATLVASSSWQQELYTTTWDWSSVVIPPMFHALPTDRIKSDPNCFIYASAAVKGFDATLEKWQSYRKLYSELKAARLYVISSGYDQPKVVADSSVIYLGTLTDSELWTYLARCAGLFYVNVFQETYGATAAMAEFLGTRTHILCLSGFGALKETLSDHRFLTDDHDQFRFSFLEHYGTNTKQVCTKDHRPETTLKKWLEIIG